MIPIFLAQLAKERRNPLLIILFIVASVGATVFFTGGTKAPTTIAIFSEGENAQTIEEKWEPLLNEQGDIRFVITDSEAAREDVQQGRSDLAVKLLEHDYQLITSSNLPTIQYMDQHVRKVFEKEAFIEAATSNSNDPTALRIEMEEKLDSPVLKMDVTSINGNELSSYNMGTQLMFAFTLLVAMFIIGFRVNNVLKDKVYGLWDRMILSPVSKTGMYTGYISYAFFIGFAQTFIVLLVFKYILNYDLGNRLDLLVVIIAFFTFSMVSVATLLTGLLRKPEHFYAIYPSVIPMIPLVSGAYMMPGTITNPILTFVGDLFPLSHAMDAILDVVIYAATWQDIIQPLVLMALIGVIAMGIGINLVERRS
ncbi:ABC transporter permease [Pseudogracilibacillus auburnensis]|uniref:ABC transporter permease n=1 Tax=Pseudogracilibacillus auburnensis TaxID=1494959 RepID=UPI001A96A227|nr:ABC transporter permease [Pseudogracilibacillus auburnensis]MBO1001636.1 ABC transporter permease [Pseudogracilibacillus auburnensis]